MGRWRRAGACGVRDAGQRPGLRVRLLAAALILAFLAIALVESLLRLVDLPRSPRVGWNWASSPYRAPFADDAVNQLGYRGRKFVYSDDDTVVLLLGDSHVEAGYQIQRFQPERLLEAALAHYGVEKPRVFSLASAGWSFDQQLLALEEYFARYRADIVVHWTTPQNDFWEAGNIDRHPGPAAGPLKPTFKIAESGGVELVQTGLGWKLMQLLRLAIARLSREEATLASLVVDEWDSSLPSGLRPGVERSECPGRELDETRHRHWLTSTAEPRYSLLSPHALERSRTHWVASIVPLSDRDRHFVELTGLLQREIVRLTSESGADYFPIVVKSERIERHFSAIGCVISKENGAAYRIEYGQAEALMRTNVPGLSTLAITVDEPHYEMVSDLDWHFNALGNLAVMAEVARNILANDEEKTEVKARSPDVLRRSLGMFDVVDAAVDFSEGGNSYAYTLSGFSSQDAAGRWVEGTGRLLLRLPSDGVRWLRFHGDALLYGSLTRHRFRIFVNDQMVLERVATAENRDEPWCIPIPPDTRFEDEVEVRIVSDDSARPMDLGLNQDGRYLSVFARRLEILPDSHPCRES